MFADYAFSLNCLLIDLSLKSKTASQKDSPVEPAPPLPPKPAYLGVKRKEKQEGAEQSADAVVKDAVASAETTSNPTPAASQVPTDAKTTDSSTSATKVQTPGRSRNASESVYDSDSSSDGGDLLQVRLAV